MKKRIRRRCSMKIRAQIGMVLNLDKCIGCHTCSVTCKNVWTNRPLLSTFGLTTLNQNPASVIRRAGRSAEVDRRLGTSPTVNSVCGAIGLLSGIFANSKLPQIDDYYEPFTFDYQNLQKPRMKTYVTAQPISYLTGKRMKKINNSACMGRQSGRCRY